MPVTVVISCVMAPPPTISSQARPSRDLRSVAAGAGGLGTSAAYESAPGAEAGSPIARLRFRPRTSLLRCYRPGRLPTALEEPVVGIRYSAAVQLQRRGFELRRHPGARRQQMLDLHQVDLVLD